MRRRRCGDGGRADDHRQSASRITEARRFDAMKTSPAGLHCLDGRNGSQTRRGLARSCPEGTTIGRLRAQDLAADDGHNQPMGFQHLFGNAPDVLGSRRRNRSLITLSASSAAKIFRTIAVRMTSMSETKSEARPAPHALGAAAPRGWWPSAHHPPPSLHISPVGIAAPLPERSASAQICLSYAFCSDACRLLGLLPPSE